MPIRQSVKYLPNKKWGNQNENGNDGEKLVGKGWENEALNAQTTLAMLKM